MRLIRFNRIGAALAIAVGGAGAALGPPQPALAYLSGPLLLEVEAESPGRLVARGAAVDVPVLVTCTATSEGFVSVTLTQRVNGGVAQGVGSTDVGCTGQDQRIIVRVTASVQGQAFRAKSAVAASSLFGCVADFNCGVDLNSTVINVRR